MIGRWYRSRETRIAVGSALFHFVWNPSLRRREDSSPIRNRKFTPHQNPPNQNSLHIEIESHISNSPNRKPNLTPHRNPANRKLSNYPNRKPKLSPLRNPANWKLSPHRNRKPNRDFPKSKAKGHPTSVGTLEFRSNSLEFRPVAACPAIPILARYVFLLPFEIVWLLRLDRFLKKNWSYGCLGCLKIVN